jgi:hypothetical protein
MQIFNEGTYALPPLTYTVDKLLMRSLRAYKRSLKPINALSATRVISLLNLLGLNIKKQDVNSLVVDRFISYIAYIKVSGVLYGNLYLPNFFISRLITGDLVI